MRRRERAREAEWSGRGTCTDLELLRELDLDVSVDGNKIEVFAAASFDTGLGVYEFREDRGEHLARPAPASGAGPERRDRMG